MRSNEQEDIGQIIKHVQILYKRIKIIINNIRNYIYTFRLGILIVSLLQLH